MTDTPDLYAAARTHVAGVAAHLQLPADHAERLARRLEGAMVMNPASGALGFLDGSQDVAGWLRNVERTEPALLGKSVPPKTATSAAAPSTSADMMQQVRTGVLSAAEAASRLLAQRTAETVQTPAKTASGPQTVSQMMAAVRRGEPGAQAVLEARMRSAF